MVTQNERIWVIKQEENKNVLLLIFEEGKLPVSIKFVISLSSWNHTDTKIVARGSAVIKHIYLYNIFILNNLKCIGSARSVRTPNIVHHPFITRNKSD